MPIKESAKKYMRVSKRKTEKNRKIKGTFRATIKKTQELVKAEKFSEAQEELKKAIKAIDKAAQKKVIKKNTAARKKSRLNKLVKKASQEKK